ncbi:membrane protein YoeI [Raoultella planticola]|nr:membrane protein YoeI [Raoultella planticola]
MGQFFAYALAFAVKGITTMSHNATQNLSRGIT